MIRFLLATLIGLFAITAAQAQTPGNPKRAPNLTCSFIANECVKACSREAPQDFCAGYCEQTRVDCIKTGKWTGIRRRYTHVQQR